MTRLGVYGGTFDPVHNAHLLVAADVRAALGLDEVLLVPAGDPWQKRGSVVAAPADRARMAELAVAEVEGVSVSRIEVARDAPSVTADTLEHLAAPDLELFLLLGADAAANMPTWRRLEETRHLATVVVVEREGEHADPPGPGWRWLHVAIPRLDISSSEIRDRLAAGRPVDGMVPPATLAFIREHDLYTAPR
ncbi:MAG: nicotinate-nucleotide adenylyltransferase [Acidimicrobiia bacterium]